MKKRNRLLALLLSLAMLLTFMPAMAFASAEGEAASDDQDGLTAVAAQAADEGEETVEREENSTEEYMKVKEDSETESEDTESSPDSSSIKAQGDGDLAITSFTVSDGTDKNDPIDTGEEITYKVTCTGADGVTVYWDWLIYQYFGWGRVDNYPGDEDVEVDGTVENSGSYDSSGSYIIHVKAWNDDGDVVEADKTVYVEATKGTLALTEPENIPAYIVADSEENLEFTAQFPENGGWMAVNVRIERDDEEDERDPIYVADSDGDDIKVSIDNNKFKEGDTIGINMFAGGVGYESAYLDYSVPVIAAPSENAIITVSDDHVLVNENTKVTIAAADKSKRKISEVQLYDGYGYWGKEKPDEDGDWTRDINFGNTGTFVVFAKVWLDDNEEYVVTTPVTVTATSNGNCGDFDITKFAVNGKAKSLSGNSEDNPLSIDRGDDIAITCSKSEYADNYWVDIDRYETDDDSDEGGFVENWKDYGYDSGENAEIDFNTIELNKGLYRIRVHANATGYSTADATTEVYVSVADKLGNKPVLEVSKGDEEKNPLTTCEEFTIKTYIPGADWIEVYWDVDNNGDWSDVNGGGDSWYSTVCPYRDAGSFTVRAVGYKEGDENEEGKEVGRAELTVYVEATGGSYNITIPEFPDYLVAGSEASKNINFTIDMPTDENGNKAEGMQVNAWWNYNGNDNEVWELRDEEDFEDDLYWDETESDTLTVSFDASYVPADSTICVRVEAWGYDHKYSDIESEFPVIAETSDKVTITASASTIPVNKDMKFVVKTTDDNVEIDKVRFYNSYNYWDEEGPDENYTNRYIAWTSFNEKGEHIVYAKVKLAGSEGEESEWLYTEPVTVTATSKGSIGSFGVTAISVDGEQQKSTTNVEAKRGSVIVIKYGAADHATVYRADILRRNEWNDWEWYKNKGEATGNTITLATADLEEGEYGLVVKASATGYEEAETDVIGLTVTNSEVSAKTLTLKVTDASGVTTAGNKKILQAGEGVTFSAYCPDATYIRIYKDYEEGKDNRWCDDNLWDAWQRVEENEGENGEYMYVAQPGFSNTDSYGQSGTHIVKAVAYGEPEKAPDSDEFTDGEVIATASIEVTVTAKGDLKLSMPDLPDKVCADGGGFSFTIEKPDNADGVEVDVAYLKNGTEDDWVNVYWGYEYGDIEVDIDTEDLVEGTKLYVDARAWGTGYNNAEDEVIIDVVDHSLSAVAAVNATCTTDGHSAYWKCDICGKYFADEAGTNEIANGSWTIYPATGHSWDAGTVTTEATEENAGVRTYTCARCGATRTEEIPQIVYAVTLPKVSISKPTAGKKKMTVKWKKVSAKNQKKIGGIEIQYIDNGVVKTVTAGKKKTSKVIKGLTSKSKVKVRVRAYKGSGDSKEVSKWSGWKTVKIK